MIKITNVEVLGMDHAIRGMRNPLNSHDRSDSFHYAGSGPSIEEAGIANPMTGWHTGFEVGENDHELMMKLSKGGPVHAKYRRFITVYLDILAPLYWWKEWDVYKVGTDCNSCSTMHTIHKKEFTLEDFSYEHLIDRDDDSQPFDDTCTISELGDAYYGDDPEDILEQTVNMLNKARERYLETEDKKYWWQMIQLLPSSYNQLRTIKLNYEVLANMYKWRKNHKLDEWVEFCKWIESLPYSEIITGKEKTDGDN